MSQQILPSLVTAFNPYWPEHIQEIKEQGISPIALFLTGLDKKERHRCYRLLSQIKGLQIPFVHLRSDMDPVEVAYLVNHFGTQKFNIHPTSDFPLAYNLDAYARSIYIENSGSIGESDLLGFAGLCLDLSHLEESRLLKDAQYEVVGRLLNKYPLGANHLSAFLEKPFTDESGSFTRSSHTMYHLTDFDYLKHYSGKYLGEYLTLEMVNPLLEQLRLIIYLQGILELTA